METSASLRSRLSKHADLESSRLDKLLKSPDTLDTDVAFFEQAKAQRLSMFAYNEHVRAEHMLLKTALDGVQ